jgi:hypothetical protein
MEKIIDRETKVLMLQVLKQGYSTCKQRVMIVSAFQNLNPQPDYDFSFLTEEERNVLLRISEKF